MRLIHLSDLHIGKRFEDVSLIEDQAYILDEILRVIDMEGPQAVLIAGDVYDKSMPTAEAVTLFDSFLSRLAERDLQVLIISGNHDSPERLSFGSKLMERTGIHISPVYNGTVEPITLEDEYGGVRFYLLPFIKPVHVRRFFPDAEIGSYTDACRAAVEQMEIDTSVRNVLLTHQFVTGAATCESEEISVGGSDNVDASVFHAFDYVALGHIHGPQNIGANAIRYCGTPLKYSFSEADHHKSVTVVDLGAKGDLTLHTVPLTARHDMRVIRGTFAQLTDPDYYRHTEVNDYLHVILTDEEDVAEAMGRLRMIYPNIRKLSYDNIRTRTDYLIEGAEDVRRKTPMELFAELYELQNGRSMTEEQTAFLAELIESCWEETV